MIKRNNRFIIIDANALLHRSYHALPPLRNKEGMVVNAVYGFLTVLFKVMREFKPTYIAAAFDRKEKTFRHKEFTEYKAGRVKPPDEFYEQIPLSQDTLAILGIPVLEKSGFEADDVIGTVATENEKKNIETLVVTGDKDAFQLISPHTKVYTLRKGVSDTITYDEKAFTERYGFPPEQMIDFKAIAGDPSDNIPGVTGIGEKGAMDLIQEFGSVENIYTEAEKGDAGKIKPRYLKKLQGQKKQAFMSKRLATIVRNVEFSFDTKDCVIELPDMKKAFEFFQRQGFKSLLPRLQELGNNTSAANKEPTKDQQKTIHDGETEVTAHNSSQKSKVQYELVDTDEAFVSFLTQLKKQKAFALDTETTHLDPFRAKLLGISFSWKEGQAFYLNSVKHPTWLKGLKPILEAHTSEKFGHNIKYDILILRQQGIEISPVSFDSMVASYLLNSGSRGHGLDNQAFEVFGYTMQPITDLIGKGRQQISMDLVPLDKLSWYACEDADYTYRLCRHFRPELEEKNMLDLMQKIEIPLIPVLATLEQNGVKIDTEILSTMSHEVGRKLTSIERKIYDFAGTTFNINSPLQLKEILFERLKISTEGISRTKTGYSTAASELEKMKDKHEMVPLLIEYRELAKLRSTYLEALPKLVNQKTGRIHTSFNQTITATGRLSSSDPNFQNIPIRTEEGRKIRKAFIAEKGKKIVAADYSQIELRIIASLANDEKMIESFRRGEDIHRRTAADIHSIPLDDVTKQQRYEAKEVNFGILYGMGAWGLASRQGMSRERARAFIEKYFFAHQEIQEYLATTISLAHEQEYVETLFGRRRYLPEINASIPQVRAAAERMAVNMPVQGTAADLMKIAMINVQKKLNTVSPKTRMILQVHDELVFEVPKKDIDTVVAFIVKEMNSAYTLKVPIVTDVAVGQNWGSLKEFGI